MTRPNPKPQDQSEPDGPAVVTSLHVWDRPATDNEMRPILGKRACRKWTPLEAAYEQGKLGGGSAKYDAKARLNAGLQYASIWDSAQSSGRDSTQALNVSRSSGGMSLGQAQSDAIKALVAIEGHMGQRDRIICRKVMGDGCFPSEAVRMVCADYRDAVAARFREALDALCDALAAHKGKPGRVSLEPRP